MPTTDTSLDAFETVREEGEDVSVRKKVLAAIANEPRTTNELAKAIDGHGPNAIRPRVNELVLMGCIEREGKRTNPSGHDAYVHHITDKGRLYLDGHIEPSIPERLSTLKGRVVTIAREVVRGNADLDVLQIAIEQHDETKRQMDPEWEP